MIYLINNYKINNNHIILNILNNHKINHISFNILKIKR